MSLNNTENIKLVPQCFTVSDYGQNNREIKDKSEIEEGHNTMNI